MLALAVIFINLALVFYTIGVWGEKRAGALQHKHLFFFLLGLVCDTTGTSLMSLLAGDGGNPLHALTGLAALILMLVHAVWAALVKWKGSAASQRRFHKFSLTVWGLWLVPYLIGVVMSMT
ncbi:TIGR03987 family protein [Paenibacillus profundus]|uniref:TIGR03987 family protein n=1 Tax=Paenibacillus profundus TaxID=1173085 RepID=A0ABS8YP84_9BACL|nr:MULTISPECIES: HsmA family protein [Paenibacillus]MCE5173630.1 TIGR03987 family protein [Paenibacillus profundus]MCM3337999.1 TIGR03987 family protein [Paenibacillus sp. MER TA 81-3]